MVTFRVHLGDASSLDIDAEAPKEAIAKALEQRPKTIVIKVKRLREKPVAKDRSPSRCPTIAHLEMAQ